MTENFQDLQATVSGEGEITAPFSGQIIATPAAVTPRPPTLIELLIGGISGLGLYVRRPAYKNAFSSPVSTPALFDCLENQYAGGCRGLKDRAPAGRDCQSARY